MKTAIEDKYGDLLIVDSDDIFCPDFFFITVQESQQETTVQLDRKQIKQLRKSLKRALNEG